MRQNPMEYWIKEAGEVAEKSGVDPILQNKRIPKRKKYFVEMCEEPTTLQPVQLFSKEIMMSPRRRRENTDVFVARCRTLLSKVLADNISEKARVDMVYGLWLDVRIRKHLRREDFSDFAGLLR
ncbi:hypothetical protein SFRURICE_014989 [Spodoptera frugiperda]|uniref:SFRICE_024826 n=1 Tax=Spodoptera frugiperda TaxID=7108 RepID=A0A2H1W787_SPOFR|nr:hypothetical protein SFRURICE_014989 [Spodoptera frugiperda]